MPFRGAFYYPWYPETWTVGGQPIKYVPVLGQYDNDAVNAAAVFDQHIAWMALGKIDVAIVSWWGQAQHNEAARLAAFKARIAASGTGLKWCIYYEVEGTTDPTSVAIAADLAYLTANYTSDPGYLKIGGKPVIFVYNSGDTAGVNALARWSTATAGAWHYVMKVFGGFDVATPQPSDWHQYGPASATDHQAGHSFTISPGYFQANEATPRLARDITRWRANIREMVASGETWQLITSFNEWGEGHAVEPELTKGTLWLDALAADGGETPSPDFVFNAARGAVAEKVRDGAANLGVMLLKAQESDAVMRDRATLAEILAHSTEATFTNYARKTGLTATLTVDTINDKVLATLAAQVWAAAGTVVGNELVKLIVYYQESASDAGRIPLTAHSFLTATNGTDLTAALPNGFYRADAGPSDLAARAALAATPEVLISGAIVRDVNGALQSAPVTWPDGTPGALAATQTDSRWKSAVNAYTITYGSPPTQTFSQPAVARDLSTGAVTNRPAIVVS